MTTMLWGVVGLSFGLSVYTATVLQDKIRDKEHTLTTTQANSELIPSLPFPEGLYDSSFLQRYTEVCGRLPTEVMNDIGGFTSAENCPKLSRTHDWNAISVIDRELMCKSFQAYSADNFQIWGHCEYDKHVGTCAFIPGNRLISGGPTDSTECTNDITADSATDLQTTSTYMLYRQNNGYWPQDYREGTGSNNNGYWLAQQQAQQTQSGSWRWG